MKRVDDSGGAGNLFLTDSQADFPTAGVEPNVGMVLYNLTTGDSGPVTSVALHTLTATGVTWTDGDGYRIVAIPALQIASIENILEIVSADVSAALQSSGQCDCTLSSVGLALAKKLNIIEAGLFYTCPCGDVDLTDDQRATLVDWMTTQLDNIRNGNLELCEGFTGAEFPAIAIAEMSVTEFAANQILINRIHRTGTV